MTIRHASTALLACSVAWVLSTAAVEAQIHPQHAAQIRKAAKEVKPRVAPKKPRTVLIWNTPPSLMEKDPHKGYCIPYGEEGMRAIGEASGAFQPVSSDDLAMYTPENIKQFDAIILNNASGPWISPTAADMAKPALKKYGTDATDVEMALRKSFVDFLENGGGVVCLHFAIAANQQWPEFKDIFGATFTGHPWNEEIGVTVEEPKHPLVAAFGKDFRLADEIYEYGPPFDRAKLRVLLSLDPARTNMGVRWINRKDNDFALAWVKPYRNGRVFNTSFGHRAELFSNPQVLQFYLDAIQFATGDLEAPTTPRPDRPVKHGPGPTSPEVRAEKLKSHNVGLPSDEQIRKMEAAAPNAAPARPAKPRRVLVWGHVWTHGPNPYAERALEILAKKTGAFTAVVSDDPRLLLADRLPQFDVLVMNNIHEPEPFLPADLGKLPEEQQAAAKKLDQAVKQSILEFVESGQGIVGIHAATAALGNWREYGEMLGGFYGGHISQNVNLKLDDAQHPINACFGGKSWSISDEIYIPREPYSRSKLHILLSLDLGQMADPGKRPDKDYAVSWVREFGKGRVFYTTLGHAAETYWNPLFLQHLLAAIQFAAGDLKGDAAPSLK